MKTKFLIAISLVAIVTASCVKRADKAEQARNDYTRSLNDSIEALMQQIDSCNQQIGSLRDRISVMITDFTTIANPREVGAYTLPSSFASKYPPKSTALVARIGDSGGFELVAALSGKAFERITVEAPSVSAATETVSHDQALNYRTAELTTVLFSGAAADSVGSLISDNELNPVTVIYEQGGRPVQSLKLPGELANEIAQTYRLYKAQADLSRLEARVPMLHEKINLLRIHLDKRQKVAPDSI